MGSCEKNAKTCRELEMLNVNVNKKLTVDIVLNSFPNSYDKFILTYHLNNTKTIWFELHNLLQTSEVGMNKSHSNSDTSA